MFKGSRKFFLISFSLSFSLGLVFLIFILGPVQAANVNVNATIPFLGCGNGVVDGGEACDGGSGAGNCYNNYCNSDCTCPVCGDSVVGAGETCDPPSSESGSSGCAAGYFCNNSCSCQAIGTPPPPPPPPPVCVPSTSCGACVAGQQTCINLLANCTTVTFTQSCYIPVCGNGTKDPGEECDDGNLVSGDGCSASCQTEVGCGNGQIGPGEECDDGNITSGDCCSATCQTELLIRSVSAQAGQTTITISWATPCQATNSMLEWGRTTAVSDGSTSLSGSSFSHTVSNLDKATVYYYKITASAGTLQATYSGSVQTLGAVEICTNGIDDDSDGFVDIADTDCPCQAEWACIPANWDDVLCISNQKTRTCEKINNCWSNEPLPQETIGCEACAGITCPPNYVIDPETCECLPLPAECGNGICEPPAEDPYSCPFDCRVPCLSDWECGPWQPEVCPPSGIQTRDCFDRHTCEVPINRPPIIQSCGGQCQGLTCGFCQQINIEQCICEEQIPCCGNGFCESGESHEQCPQDCILLCMPNWTCLGWGICESGIQKRECYDLNKCDLLLDKPPEIRSCNAGCDVACSTCQMIDLNSCSCFATVPCCGNNVCEDKEMVWSCPVDCGLPPEFRLTLTQCLDGLDNDQDGFVDYPADPGCNKPSDNSELNFAEIIENVQEFIQDDILNNPQVDQANEQIATPVLIATVAVNTFATFSFFNFFSYLQFFITQPFAAFFRRKRRKWGVVYNSLTKQPIDLAIIRLYKQENAQLIQSRVTDKLGRYSFLVEPGRYYLTVTKPKHNFPTEYLKDAKEDVKYLDLYHGETIEVKGERVDIIVNIPIDPQAEEKPVAKVIIQHYLRKVQYIAAFSAIPLATISMIISPGALTFTMFGFHCLLYILFRRLGYQKPPKNWGIIYDKDNRKPLGRAITRIYDKHYNKLLETRVTDVKGRYSFLVNNNVYFMTAEKLGYKLHKTEDIDLVSKDREAIVGLDIGLEKAKLGETPVVPSVTAAAKPTAEAAPPESKIGMPAKLEIPKIPPVTPVAAPELKTQLPESAEPKSALVQKIESLEVGRESLQEVLVAKEKIQDIKEEIEDKKEELAALEDKVESIEESIEEKLEKIDQEKPTVPEVAKEITEKKSEPKAVKPEVKPEDKSAEPPKEKSIFG